MTVGAGVSSTWLLPSLQAAWLALLGLVLPIAVLQAPTQVPATLGWSISILACVAWALYQAASGPAMGRRLALLAGIAGSAVVALAVATIASRGIQHRLYLFGNQGSRP